MCSAGVLGYNDEAAEVWSENTDCRGNYKENKRGGDTEKFFILSLCGRWRSDVGQSRFTDLAIQMHPRSLLDTIPSNYGPKVEKFVHFCEGQL